MRNYDVVFSTSLISVFSCLAFLVRVGFYSDEQFSQFLNMETIESGLLMGWLWVSIILFCVFSLVKILKAETK